MLKSVLNAALLITLVLCLVAATILFGGILTEYALPWYALVVLLVTLWAMKLLLCRPVAIVWSPMHVPVALFAGYALCRYLTSPIEYESRLEAFQIGLYTLMYFVIACNFYRTRGRTVIVGALVLLAVAEAVYGLWQSRAQADIVLWLERGGQYHGRGSGTYFCPNHLAGLLEMAFGMLVARLLVSRGSDVTLQSTLVIKLYGAVAAVFVALGLLATFSRGGWIATVAALMVLLVWAKSARVLSSRMVISTLLLLAVAGTAAWSVPRIRSRIEQEVRLKWDYTPGAPPVHVVEGLAGRYPMWKATVKMIRDHPMLGTGPGTWSWLHLKYREPGLQIRPRYAHQDVLQLASDYGLVGVLLVVAILGCFYRQAWRLARYAEPAEQRSFALGASAAVTAILVHSFGDFNLHIPANALWVVTLMGLTINQSVSGKKKHRKELHRMERFYLGLMLLVAAADVAIIGVRLSFGSRFTERGYDANQRFEWEESHAWYRRALQYDAGNPETHAQIGDAYRIQSAQAESPGEQSNRQQLVLLAVEAYRRSLALNPFQSEVMLRLAAAYELAGDNPAALAVYDKALTVDPHNAFNWLRLGVFYRRIGETARAIEALQRSQRLNNLEPIAQGHIEEIAAESAVKP